MEITFRTKKIEKVCKSEKELQKSYGKQNAKVIWMRIKFLRSASNLSQILTTEPFKLHQLQGNKKGHYAVNLQNGLRLVFIPNHNPVPRKKDGGIDKEQVTEIKIIDILNYH